VHIRHRTLLYASLFVVVAAFPLAAQQSEHEHSGQPPAQTQQGGMMGMHSPAMQSAMQHMQQGMSSMTGDPDVDFARMMIPHHQGAVEMARAELEHGKDPQLRQMAQKIIEDQEREIATLKEWLAKHPK
jgi:uncharacterized protein (DUF305 family)